MEPQQDVEMQDAGIRRLNVKTVSGDVKRFEVACDIPITALKEQIASVFNVPPERQRLIFQGKLLKDDKLLSEFVKDDDVTIHMMARAADIPPQQEQQPSSRPNPPSANVRFFGNSFNIPIEGGLGMLDNMVSSLMQNIIPGQQPRFQEPPPRPADPQPQRQPEQPRPNLSNEGRDSGQRVREMTLPFVHVHNIGTIINQMMGPNTGFPPPRMPQLNVDRNAMVLLGGYLYNYQFQVMRLIPFLSRLADLMQRESLITDPNERAMLQTLSHNVGSALLELNNATQPVVELFHHLQVGPNPGDFILRAHGNNIVSQHQSRPSVPQPQSLPNHPVPSQPIPQAPQLPNISGFLSNFMSGMAGGASTGQGVQNPLAQMIPVVSQILGGNGQSNVTLRSMVNQMEVEEPEQELPMNEFLYDLTIPELMGLMTGNIQALNRIRPTAVTNLRARMQEDSTEARERIIEEYLKFINENFVFPEGFNNRIRPGFDIRQVTLDIIQRGIRNILNLVLDYEGPDFAEKLKDKVMYMMGHWIDEFSHNLDGGEETVNQVLTAQVNQMLQRYGAEFAVLISGMSSSIVINFFRSCHQRYLSRAEMERAAQASAQGEQTTRAVLLSSWEATMTQDAITQTRMAPQRPFSAAYLSGGVYRRKATNTQEEEKTE